jgi:hypothetical protein
VIARVAHWLFAFGLFLSWANSALHVALSDRPLYIRTLRVFRGKAPAPKVIALALATVGYLALIGLFLSGQHREWVALAILVVLAAIRRFEIAQWPGDIVVRLGKYVPAAACLAAWLVTRVVCSFARVPDETADTLGWSSACGVLAGVHVLAVIAKVRESGWGWMHSRYQALLVAERAFTGPRVLRGLRSAVAQSKRVSALVGAYGFFAEAGSVLFVVPAARPFVLGAVLLLHLGFLTLLGYFELEWVVVMSSVVLLAP